MRALILLGLLAACSDPTKTAPAPTIGAIAGTVVTQSPVQPVPGVAITLRSSAQASYIATTTTDSTGSFFVNDVPAGIGQIQLRHLPTGCDSVLGAPFAVNGGMIDSTTVTIPCGA